jgi:hypothetical protein
MLHRKKWREVGGGSTVKSFKLACLTKRFSIMESRRMRWVGHVAFMGEGRNALKMFVGKPEGVKPPGKPRHR